MQTRLGQFVRIGLLLAVIGCVSVLAPVIAYAAPYAAMVVDARSGKVLHSRNADTQLHPASLTKMMTLYIAFEAVERGEISLDTVITVSANAAAEPPSKLGLKSGQRIKLRYLIRAAAVKSANDAATAIAEAISGSVDGFARRMTRTAKAMGMTRTQFKNANGLTQSGHMSTARDMTTLGRHVFYDYPDYYNLFSRRSADAGMRQVNNTNSRFLDNYAGADGIKTGYTRAAGFNLVASAERGGERVIVTVFGGRSTAARNAQVAKLMDLGFRRAPSRVALRRPAPPAYSSTPETGNSPGKTIRLVTAVTKSPRPVPRPVLQAEPLPEDLLAELKESVADAVAEVVEAAAPEPEPEEQAALVPEPQVDEVAVVEEVVAVEDVAAVVEVATVVEVAAAEELPEPLPQPLTDPPTADMRPAPRPATIVLAALEPAPEPAMEEPEIVTRMSSSGGRHFGINIGRYGTRFQAERELVKTALKELGTLEDALRKVVNRGGGYEANFMGLTQEAAELTCRRLTARHTECSIIGPS